MAARMAMRNNDDETQLPQRLLAEDCSYDGVLAKCRFVRMCKSDLVLLTSNIETTNIILFKQLPASGEHTGVLALSSF